MQKVKNMKIVSIQERKLTIKQKLWQSVKH